MLCLSGMLVSDSFRITIVCNIFSFVTHVSTLLLFIDAGKSTIGGQIMSLTGMVDKRTLEKYEREAREKSRESWYLSWALDTNQEGKRDSCSVWFKCING